MQGSWVMYHASMMICFLFFALMRSFMIRNVLILEFMIWNFFMMWHFLTIRYGHSWYWFAWYWTLQNETLWCVPLKTWSFLKYHCMILYCMWNFLIALWYDTSCCDTLWYETSWYDTSDVKFYEMTPCNITFCEMKPQSNYIQYIISYGKVCDGGCMMQEFVNQVQDMIFYDLTGKFPHMCSKNKAKLPGYVTERHGPCL